MTAREQEISDDAYVVRIVAALVGMFFFALAIKMGVEALHAWTVGMPMSNWRGGVMGYEKGIAFTALFTGLALLACFCAVRPQSSLDRWASLPSRTRMTQRPNKAPEPTPGSVTPRATKGASK